MKGELEHFIRFLHTEKGFSQGTIEAYQLDLERGLVPFLCLLALRLFDRIQLRFPVHYCSLT